MRRAGFLLLALLAASCGATRQTPAAPTAVAFDQNKPAITVDVTSGSVTIQVGDELAVRSPDASRHWTVTGAEPLLQLVSLDQQSSVGADGWRFRAQGAGESELMFTGHIIPDCPKPPNCPSPPAPPSITLRVVIRP